MIRLTFTDPIYLWYLLSVPLLIITHFFLLRHTKSKAIKFANFTALQRVSKERIFTGNYLVLFIRLCILMSLIFAIAGMTVWYQGRTNNNSFIIAIDVSASMASQDVSPTRLETAKQYALEFVDGIRSNADIGVVAFSGVPFILQVPTDDKGKVHEAIQKMDIITAGGTDIPGAIITSTNLLATMDGGKTVILLTDGSTTSGYLDDDPMVASSDYALSHNVRVHTLGVGQLGGPIGYLPEFYNITAVYEENDLQFIANRTGGKYYHALSSEEVKTAYDAFAQDAHTAWIRFDMGSLLLLAGLLFLFLEWGMINTRFKRVP